MKVRVALLGLADAVVAAVRRVLVHTHPPIVSTDLAGLLSALGTTLPTVLMISGERPDFAATCAAVRVHAAFAEATIIAVLAAPGPNSAQLLASGADDFYVESLGDGLLRIRLEVADHAASLVQERKESEKETERFFNMSTDLLCIAGLDGKFLRTNRAWTQTTGWTPAQLTTEPWLAFVHPDDVAATLAAGARLQSDEQVTSFTNRYRCSDGSYRWLEWTAVPVAERGLIYATARDVTQARSTQRAMDDLTESLATTLSSIGDGVISADLSARVVRMNPVAEQLTGWPARDAVGRPAEEVLKLVDGTTLAPAQNPIVRVVRDGVAAGLAANTQILRRDGTRVPIGDSCAPILDVSGRLSGAVLVFRDLTRELAAETARTKVQEQLIFADRMASVGTLAAGVAHEINNPLTYVISNLDSILEEIRELSGGSTSGRMRDLEDMAVEALEGAERVRKIVRGLKTFSRAADERKAVADVTPILELSINMAFTEIRHRARLVKDFGPTPLIEVDDARLGQVFINLLVNAAQAIGMIERADHELRVVTRTDAEGRAVVEFRDTGPGITRENMTRIFDPFFTTKPVGVGTGLGLAICHSILESMGGSISVESVEGHGATFRVIIPPAGHDTTAEAKVVRARTRASILVIDDEPAIGMAISRVLRAHDITVLTDARQAISMLESPKRFDLVISDVMMPNMSGIELYDHLANHLPDVAPRMVFITGGASTPSVAAFLDRISNERLDKPFTPDALRALVEKFLRP